MSQNQNENELNEIMNNSMDIDDFDNIIENQQDEEQDWN